MPAGASGTIEVKHAGVSYSAAYSVRNGKVHILTPLGSPLRSPPETRLRQLPV